MSLTACVKRMPTVARSWGVLFCYWGYFSICWGWGLAVVWGCWFVRGRCGWLFPGVGDLPGSLWDGPCEGKGSFPAGWGWGLGGSLRWWWVHDCWVRGHLINFLGLR